MDEKLVAAQALGWRIAIVRAIHGPDVDALSIEELLAEYERLQRNIVTVKRKDGGTETMSELQLRLEYERVR